MINSSNDDSIVDEAEVLETLGTGDDDLEGLETLGTGDDEFLAFVFMLD